MRTRWMVLAAVVLLAAAARAETVKVEAAKDNSICFYPGEERDNAGDRTRLRVKGNQHLLALGFDLSVIRGRIVTKAVLVCEPADHRVGGVTISTIGAPFDEMRSNALTSGARPIEGWAWPGARFMDVCGGNGFSLVCQAASPKDGAYRWPVEPDLLHALALDLAEGLAVHEWSADYSRNPTVFSREEKDRGPFLEIELGGGEMEPAAPRILEVYDRGDPDTLRLRVQAPARGFAYVVEVDGTPLPRWNVPFVRPGEEQVIPIRDLPLAPGAEVSIAVRAVNRTGDRSGEAKVRARVPAPPPPPEAPPAPPPDADGMPIRLAAARGEVVDFECIAQGDGPVRIEMERLRAEAFAPIEVTGPSGPVSDPLRPAAGGDLAGTRRGEIYVPFDERRSSIKGHVLSGGGRFPIELAVRRFGLPERATFLCEMNTYGMPDSAAEYALLQEVAYDHRCHVNVLHYSHQSAAAGARTCSLDLRKADGRRMDEARYRSLTPGAKAGYWNDLAEVFGPFLTGRHFATGWRGPIPLPGFYTTFHESFPLNVRAFFDGNPDAYGAFKARPEYEETFVAVLRDFLRRANREGWTNAGLQVYLNNKGSLDDPKRAPWVLDEPADRFDYRAIAFYADLTRRAKEAEEYANLRFRVDISRPEFDRGELPGKADLWVVAGSAFREYPRLLADRREFTGEDMWVYGEAPPPGAKDAAILSFVIGAYLGGATGLVPWQTVARTEDALKNADPLALFILLPGPDGPVVHPTIRLKAFRRAEQDVEYLELLRRKLGLTDGQLRAFVARYVDFSAPTDEAFAHLREAAAALIETRK